MAGLFLGLPTVSGELLDEPYSWYDQNAKWIQRLSAYKVNYNRLALPVKVVGFNCLGRTIVLS